MQVQEWLIECERLLGRIKELEAENAELRKRLGENVTPIEKKPTAMQNLSIQEKWTCSEAFLKGVRMHWSVVVQQESGKAGYHPVCIRMIGVRFVTGLYSFRHLLPFTNGKTLFHTFVTDCLRHPDGETVPSQNSCRISLSEQQFPPILSANQVYSQGYYDELVTSVEAVEHHDSHVISALESIKDTYRLMDNLNGI